MFKGGQSIQLRLYISSAFAASRRPPQVAESERGAGGFTQECVIADAGGGATHPDSRRRSETNKRGRGKRETDEGLVQSLVADGGCRLSVSFNVLPNISLVRLRSKPGNGASCHGDGGVNTTVRADVQRSAASGASESGPADGLRPRLAGSKERRVHFLYGHQAGG